MTEAIYHKKMVKALDRMGSLYTLNDILDRIASGHMQSWVKNNSWAITEVVDYPRRRVLDIVVAVGDIDDILALHGVVLGYASEVNASLIRAYGRLGWEKYVKPNRWKVANYVYYRDM